VKRLLDQLGYKIDQPFRIFCDNTTTIDKVTHPNGRVATKLRHVDIQNMWLRQEYDQGKFIIEYLPTEEMPADGFTKILTRGRFEQFVKQLRMAPRPPQIGAVIGRPSNQAWDDDPATEA
jgi:hypothetical protein